MKRFLIADDHSITRSGLKLVLREHFQPDLIDEATNGAEIMTLVKANKYDFMTMDVNMPNTDALSLVETIKIFQPEIKILVLSMNKEEIFAQSFIAKGAIGYIQKSASEDELLWAIRSVIRGSVYLSEDVANVLLQKKTSRSNSDNPLFMLTSRELQIFQYLVRGDTLSNIASVMSLSQSTIATHKANILRKLKLENLHDLIQLANTHHLNGA